MDGVEIDEASITRFITDTFAGVNVDAVGGDTFFSVDPEHQVPFATIVTHDTEWDSASDLDRPSVFRLSMSLSGTTYASLFGLESSGEAADGDVATDVDFTALDRLTPHPLYGRQHWVSVLNPSRETFESVQPLLAEAHSLAVTRDARREARA